MAKITNINGTSEHSAKCKCGSWKQHWLNYNGGQKLPTYCPESKCLKKTEDLVGAHVQKAGSTDRSWYIVPLCQEHNQSKEDLTISDSINFAPANRSLTCEK
jgi:hypothetical protein